jgi:rhodanese-related sulfurtransferase
VREQDFVGYMQNLGLPHPNRLKQAVPANLECGRPGEGTDVPRPPDWGPVVRTYAGVLQVEPEWVHAQGEHVTLIDVREQEEVATAEIGMLPGARVMPLSTLREHASEVPRDRPVVCVCPAGARSAIAATILEKGGVERVANLRGGILAWRALGYPTRERDSSPARA